MFAVLHKMVIHTRYMACASPDARAYMSWHNSSGQWDRIRPNLCPHSIFQPFNAKALYGLHAPSRPRSRRRILGVAKVNIARAENCVMAY